MKGKISYLTIRILTTVLCASAAVVLIARNVKDVSSAASALIVLAAAPWLALLISELTVMGSTIKFRVDENTKDIETLKLLVRAVLTDVELEIIARLRQCAGYEVNTGDALFPGFKLALDRLIGLGYLESRREKGGYQAFIGEPLMNRDAQDYFRVTPRGMEFLKQYEEAQGGVIDLEGLDAQTHRRIAQY